MSGAFVGQSFACHRYAREGGLIKTEQDPLDPTPVPTMRQTDAAMRHLEEAVTGAGGTALRYGNFYGSPDDGLVEAVRNHAFPIVRSDRGDHRLPHPRDLRSLRPARPASILRSYRGHVVTE